MKKVEKTEFGQSTSETCLLRELFLTALKPGFNREDVSELIVTITCLVVGR
jgi:hypothetical protein